MANSILKTNTVWIMVASAAIVSANMLAGSASAQTSGTAPNSNASPPSAGSDQNRDAGSRGGRGDRGEAGRRGRGGGRFGGNGDSAGSAGNTAAAKPSTSPAPTAAPEISETERIRTWAKEIIQKHDKNGDMMLQESEWEGLGQSTKADANADHVITLDELVAFASRKPGTPPPTTNASTTPAAGTSPATVPPDPESKVAATGGAASGQGNKFVKASPHGSSESKSVSGKQKSYRFKTAKERLPAGLPGWFTAKDANGDGQVSMSEYSKSWSESTAAEFKRYDRDNDGIITAEEARKK